MFGNRQAGAVSAFFGVLLAASVPAASGAIFSASSGPGLDKSIPSTGQASDTLDLSGVTDHFISNLSVEVMIDHNDVGDLEIELQGPTGPPVRLLNNPGTNGFDELLGIPPGGGYTANLDSTLPVTFTDSATTDSNYVGRADTTGIVADEPAEPSSFRTYDASASSAPGTQLSTGLGIFEGERLKGGEGDWTLIVHDVTGVDSKGTLEGWTLSGGGTVVPTPSALTCGLALAGGLMLIRPRRSSTARPAQSGRHARG